jgi:hypothetical protein
LEVASYDLAEAAVAYYCYGLAVKFIALKEVSVPAAVADVGDGLGDVTEEVEDQGDGVFGGGSDVFQEIGFASEGEEADASAVQGFEVEMSQAGGRGGDHFQIGGAGEEGFVDLVAETDPEDVGAADLALERRAIEIGGGHVGDLAEAVEGGRREVAGFRD